MSELDDIIANAKHARAAARARFPKQAAEESAGTPPSEFETMISQPEGPPTPSASPPPASEPATGLQSASYEALAREMLRRQEAAQRALESVPTELLRIELERRGSSQ